MEERRVRLVLGFLRTWGDLSLKISSLLSLHLYRHCHPWNKKYTYNDEIELSSYSRLFCAAQTVKFTLSCRLGRFLERVKRRVHFRPGRRPYPVVRSIRPPWPSDGSWRVPFGRCLKLAACPYSHGPPNQSTWANQNWKSPTIFTKVCLFCLMEMVFLLSINSDLPREQTGSESWRRVKFCFRCWQISSKWVVHFVRDFL